MIALPVVATVPLLTDLYSQPWAQAVVVVVCAMLAVAAALTISRMVRGPTVLNRALASDVLVSMMVCALGVEAAVRDHTSTVPILISLSLVGFVGSVSVARFVARDRDDRGRNRGAEQ